MKTIPYILFVLIIWVPWRVLAQWSAPVNISPNAISAGLNESMGSCIGTNGDTVHVVWTDKHSSTKAAIYYTHSRDAGLTWSPPVAISDTNGNGWNPAIAVNGSNVHVVWREISTVSGHRASWYKHSVDGGKTWGPGVFLDSTADWPAVSVTGNMVYVVNDVVTTASPYNTEILFLRSTDNGDTWSAPRQLTFAVGRSEDEAIHAEGSHIHMSWNDNRAGAFQILYKESKDYGVTWDSDVVVDPVYDYNTMVWSNGAHTDVIATGAPSGKYQLLIAQSADTGATWGPSKDLSNDTAHTYFLPDMVRDGANLHVVCNSSGGAKYFHSGDGGTTWDAAASMPGVTFIAYTGFVLHVIYANAGQIYYLRNPTGNSASLNLTVFLQGYYIGSGKMTPALMNEDVSINSNEADTIKVSLVDSATLTVKQWAKGVLHTNGILSLSFPSSVSGNRYYLKINHRNSIETWSRFTITITSTTNYDFTTSANMAYGNNMANLGGGIWGIYTGDINQDGFIDPNDFPQFDNDSFNGVSLEYVPTDLNGDGFVDPNDFPVFDMNSFNGVYSVHP